MFKLNLYVYVPINVDILTFKCHSNLSIHHSDLFLPSHSSAVQLEFSGPIRKRNLNLSDATNLLLKNYVSREYLGHTPTEFGPSSTSQLKSSLHTSPDSTKQAP